jgi:hypothetical protein
LMEVLVKSEALEASWQDHIAQALTEPAAKTEDPEASWTTNRPNSD